MAGKIFAECNCCDLLCKSRIEFLIAYFKAFFPMNSWARRLCYPRSNFSVISSPHQGGHRGSLGQYFYSGCHIVSHPVRLAFALALYSGLLTRLSQPLGPADIFSAGCHPSQTVHLLLSPLLGKQRKLRRVVFHRRLAFLAIGKLPPTLHNRAHVATISYSKVSRGLHFPLEIPGLCTRRGCSEGSN